VAQEKMWPIFYRKIGMIAEDKPCVLIVANCDKKGKDAGMITQTRNNKTSHLQMPCISTILKMLQLKL